MRTSETMARFRAADGGRQACPSSHIRVEETVEKEETDGEGEREDRGDGGDGGTGSRNGATKLTE
jgi:hypothetical protein